jgi:hypothetical protein
MLTSSRITLSCVSVFMCCLLYLDFELHHQQMPAAPGAGMGIPGFGGAAAGGGAGFMSNLSPINLMTGACVCACVVLMCEGAASAAGAVCKQHSTAQVVLAS